MANYDFRDLSPIDFEELVRDLLQAEFGLHLESFGPGPDDGIDFRFATDGGECVVQAKHYIKSGKNGLASVLRKENSKVKQLAPRRYILATSVSLSPATKDDLIALLPDAPLNKCDFFGQEDLNNLIKKHPSVERAHFKLWLGSTALLEKILHSGVYNRTETELQTIKRMIPKFVSNDSVPKSEEILQKNGSLIISGHPGVGKTTLARMLIWLHAAQGWKIYAVDDMREAFEISAVDEQKLIFFDDFLGQVRLSADHVRGIDQRLPPFLERVANNKNLRFVLTTREYILSQAEMLSRKIAIAGLSGSKYVLNVGIYTRKVRAQILYNHIYFSELGSAQIDSILKDDFYLKIIDHQNFNPRLIDLLTSEKYAALTGSDLTNAIIRVLNNPDELWDRPYRDHISEDGRCLLIALMLRQGGVSSVNFLPEFANVSAALGNEIPAAQKMNRYAKVQKELEGTAIQIQNGRLSFSNPGVRDFLTQVIRTDRLVPLLLSAVRNLDHVQQLWNLFFDQDPHPIPVQTDAANWVRALNQIGHFDEDEAFPALRLALDIYEHFETENAREAVERFAQKLSEVGFNAWDARVAATALDDIRLRSIPTETYNDVSSIILEAAVNMIEDGANYMSLEDFELVKSGVEELANDENLSRQMTYNGLVKFMSSLDTELEGCGSVEEVEELSDRLDKMMAFSGYTSFGHTDKIQERIEYLEFKEFESSYESRSNYGGGGTLFSQNDIEIKSMFSNLASGQ